MHLGIKRKQMGPVAEFRAKQQVVTVKLAECTGKQVCYAAGDYVGRAFTRNFSRLIQNRTRFYLPKIIFFTEHRILCSQIMTFLVSAHNHTHTHTHTAVVSADVVFLTDRNNLKQNARNFLWEKLPVKFRSLHGSIVVK